MEVKFFGNEGLCLAAFPREETLMVNAVVNHPDIPFVDAKELFDVRSGILTDSDDFVLAASEEFHHDTPIKHSGEIILIGHTEGREVMDGGDERTGSRPHQPAIAGDMQEVELQTARD